jgi:death on curing protein
MIRYLSVDQVVSLHQTLIGHLRADAGVRDFRALEAAVARPALSFEGEDLYPQLDAKAAALMHALTTSAPFVDAGVETAVIAAECFLVANGAALMASDRDLERMATAVASGDTAVEALTIWFRQRLRLQR